MFLYCLHVPVHFLFEYKNKVETYQLQFNFKFSFYSSGCPVGSVCGNPLSSLVFGLDELMRRPERQHVPSAAATFLRFELTEETELSGTAV